MTGPLIDFGNSFWKSSLAADEFPGLQSEQVSFTGKSGIGFFSIFMIGNFVRVTSRRFDRDIASIHALEFKNGLASRPILYTPFSVNGILDGGTLIEVLLSEDPYSDEGLAAVGESYDKRKNFLSMLGYIAPALNVELVAEEKGKKYSISKPGDWININERKLVSRISNASTSKKKTRRKDQNKSMTLMTDGEIVYGRASIEYESWPSRVNGCIAIGGLRARAFSMIRGIIQGNDLTASRNDARFSAPPEVLSQWASEQAKMIAGQKLSGADQARAAGVVLMFGGDIGSLSIARLNGVWLDKKQLEQHIGNENVLRIYFGDIEYESDYDDVHPREFDEDFIDAPDIIFVPTELPGRTVFDDMDFLEKIGRKTRRGQLLEKLVSLSFESIWNEYDFVYEDHVIGSVKSVNIEREISVWFRELKKKNMDDIYLWIDCFKPKSSVSNPQPSDRLR